MVSRFDRFCYMMAKFNYSCVLAKKKLERGLISETQELETILRTLRHGKMTFLHSISKGVEMAPTFGTCGSTLLVRKIPDPVPNLGFPLKWRRRVRVGDVVVLKDPITLNDLIVRRLAATEGYEMASTDENDESFILKMGECWVLADNENLKPKEAYDSRTFGPVDMNDIVGRVMYCLRSAMDHGPVNNSFFSQCEDFNVLEVELDVDEMAAKNHEA